MFCLSCDPHHGTCSPISYKLYSSTRHPILALLSSPIPAFLGPSGLFKGLLAANGFAVPYYGTQFFTYDMLKETYSTFNMPEGEKRVRTQCLPICRLRLPTYEHYCGVFLIAPDEHI